MRAAYQLAVDSGTDPDVPLEFGGVQDQHYDKHTYWLEKAQALRKWAAHLAKLRVGKTADVVPLPKRQDSVMKRANVEESI